MDDIRSERITGLIAPELYEKAQKWAEKKKWSLSSVVEEALIKYLEK